ncbi:hypothetical protein HRbin39_01025 [bacterium HR39]|nr:hypothetical protein HRbin39_01025 [bacterium HR39]
MNALLWILLGLAVGFATGQVYFHLVERQVELWAERGPRSRWGRFLIARIAVAVLAFFVLAHLHPLALLAGAAAFVLARHHAIARVRRS